MHRNLRYVLITPTISPALTISTADAIEIGNAYIGKFDDLCEPDSTFLDAYADCAICVEDSSTSDSFGRRLVPHELEQALGFCELTVATRTDTLEDGGITRVKGFVPVDSTASMDTRAFMWTTSTSDSSADSNSPTGTNGGEDGERGDSNDGSDSDGSKDQARIPGPVLGGVIAGVLILVAILAAIFIFYRRRKQIAQRSASLDEKSESHEVHDEAQLHGDCIPPPEKYYAE